ncbi:MAG TPA: hypothetical protein DER02_00875 [Gammaproteobacteria bacterium]|nr:hypothetical protein [Gammaproteobacteria bacterium]
MSASKVSTSQKLLSYEEIEALAFVAGSDESNSLETAKSKRRIWLRHLPTVTRLWALCAFSIAAIYALFALFYPDLCFIYLLQQSTAPSEAQLTHMQLRGLMVLVGLTWLLYPLSTGKTLALTCQVAAAYICIWLIRDIAATFVLGSVEVTGYTEVFISYRVLSIVLLLYVAQQEGADR